MKEPIMFEAHTSHIPALRFTADSRTLITAGMDATIKLWSVPEWTLLATLSGHEKSVNSLALSPNGDTLASGSSDATVRLWSLADRTEVLRLHDRKKVVAAVRFSPDGGWVAAASYGGRAMVWTTEGEAVVGMSVRKKNLTALAFSPDADALALGGLGDDISLRKMPSGEPIAELTGHKTAVMALEFVAGGTQLISLGYDQSVRFWDVVTWAEQRALTLPDDSVRSMAVAPDETLAAVVVEGAIALRSLDDGSMVERLPVAVKALYGPAFSPNGRWLAAGAADGQIRVWAIES